MNVLSVPALADNYIHILHGSDSSDVIVVDPSEAAPVLAICTEKQWKVSDILLTHHHNDHIGGARELAAKFGASTWGFGGDSHRLPPLTHALKDGQTFTIGTVRLEVKHIPAHTLGHICYYLPDRKYLFCGDTLFAMGCGRLFEGTPEMMFRNLTWIRTLPPETQVFCGHEYTKTNTEFAMNLEPGNARLKEFYTSVVELREHGDPTVPFLLGLDRELNPMFRWDDPLLRRALGMERASDLEVFTAVRTRRNSW